MTGGGNAARLTVVTRELQERWAQTRELWTDAKAREFEDRFMKDLLSSVDHAVGRITELENLLRRIRRDCE